MDVQINLLHFHIKGSNSSVYLSFYNLECIKMKFAMSNSYQIDPQYDHNKFNESILLEHVNNNNETIKVVLN